MQYPKIKSVLFCGSNIQVVESDNNLYVAMRPICENIGLKWGSQYNRIMRDDVLNSVSYIMKTTAGDGKKYEQVFLPLKYLNGWLFGITTNKVNPEIKDKILRYKFECYDVLHSYWNKNRNNNSKMLNLNQIIFAYEKEKELAIFCGKGLVRWKKAKPKLENQISKMIEESQLRLTSY